MTNVSFTFSEKKKIRKRIDRRAAELEDRLVGIPKGHKFPNKENQRLNEPKEYEVAMVFLDIDDFSNYAFKHKNKAVLYMLGLLIPEMMKLVSEYDGYFEKNTGDGLLAYFGFEKDASNSVANLLAYLSTVRWALVNEINPLLDEKGLDRISVSGGATYGKVYLTRFGERDHSQELNRLTGVSSSANIASRLEEKATDGQFLTGPNVWYHADRPTLKKLLKLTDAFNAIRWTNPDTDEPEPYQIYEYRGNWESLNGADRS